MSVWDPYGDSGIADPIISPFEAGKNYPDYEVTKKGEIITIKTADDLELDLKIVGERVYRDEKHGRDYLTDSYLFREEESKE